MNDDWDKLLQKAQEIADAKGAPKKVMVKHFRRALRLIDRASSQNYKAATYRWDGVRYDRRPTGIFREFISRANAYKYQWKNTKRFGLRYRSMIRRSADSGYAGNLAHLVEDGAWNVKHNKQSLGNLLRRKAFDQKKAAAEREAINGIREAVKAI